MSIEKIKLVRKLKMKKFREETKLFVAEGLRLCEMSLKNEIKFGFYTKNFLKSARQEKLLTELEKITSMIEISDAVFSKLSDTETPQGILLVLQQNLSTIEKVVEKFLIVVLDEIKDPGNVGTILRTSEAFNCGVIILNESADIFNPKVVRASMGAIFNLPIAKASYENFLKSMKNFDIEINAAILDKNAEKYFLHDFTKKSAIIFGNEIYGVNKKIFKFAKKIYIPMSGESESLNVATASGIIISEAVRQNNTF